ncbi:hypothetical protein BDV96DRAFT_583465 [Lophiotrema nucula]|uniref:Uncharacterized protein n=1 Tax=Lophiotrema nucula TaxID=690887 RepID=A0A6A5YVR0_9PLEO|nr:hypothetical protein BDV96DRAFT_583465 [Lophiotrema nucula]
MTEAGPIFNNYDDQPAARSSNAATSPALWEDVVQRFHHGRYHEIVEGDTVTKIDQKEMVLFKMMDMRPARQDDPDGEPRRLPMVYECKGIPLNWKNKVLVKAMNDRRYQALQRARNAPRWDARERAHIVALLNEFPDISITELTERLNFRFKGDAVESSMLPPHKLHPGRTIEDVRAEYLEHKEKYDAGIVPTAPRMNKELGLEEKKTAKALEEIYKIFAPTDKDGKPINVPAKRTRRSKKEIEKDDSLDYTNDGGEADEADESMTSMSTSPKKFSVATPKAKEILKPKSQIAKAIKGKTSTSALPVKKSKAVKATRTAPDASKLAKKRKAMDDFPSNSMPIPLMKSRKRVKLSDVMLADKLESAARDPKKAQLFRMQDENGNYTKKFDDQLLSLAGYSSDEAEAAGALVQMSAGPDRMDALVKELLEVADLIRDRATAMRETEEVSARVDRDGDSEMEDSVEEGSDDSGAAEEEDDDEEIII